MNASESARRLAKDLRAENVVAAPDHPFLLLCPDVLAVDGAGLVALFVDHVRELRSPDRLQARLVLSKLALPSHTSFVHVTESPNEFADGFDAVLSPQEVRSVFARRSARLDRRGRASAETLGAVRARAQQALSNERYGEFSARQLARLGRSRIATVADGRLVSDAAALGGESAVAQRIRDLMVVSVRMEFTLDQGVVYAVDSGGLPVHALHLGKRARVFTSRSFDVGKLRRSAAFAGWSIEGLVAQDFASDEPDLAEGQWDDDE